MAFSRALEANPAPRRVGPVRLRYEDSLLIGERGKAGRGLGGILLAGAGGAGAGSLACLVPGADHLVLALLLAGAAAVAVAAAIYADQRARATRRFILNFAAETLRLDAPAGLRSQPRTTVVPFDAVKDVTVVPRDGGFALEATLGDAPAERVILVDPVPPRDVEALRVLWRVLRAAVGLKAEVGLRSPA